MIAKLNIVTTLAAIVLFLFPWLDVRCSGRTMVTQTGLQTVYGGVSESKELKELSAAPPDANQKREKGSTKAGILTGIALAATLAGCAFAFTAFIHGKRSLRPPALCAIALLCLVIQSMMDFPIRRDLAEQMSNPPPQAGAGDPFGRMGQEMGKAVLAQIQVRYLPAFYLELLALGIPTLLLANGLLDRLKKREAS